MKISYLEQESLSSSKSATRAKVHIVFGPQGAGKTSYAHKLAKEEGAVVFSIDAWMWKLYGPDLPKPMNYGWIMERVGRCESQIWSSAQQVASCGCPVILDLAFTQLKKRESFQALAADAGLDAQLHYLTAPLSLRKKRVLQRNTDQGASFSFEVSPAMFGFMEDTFEPATEQELSQALYTDTSEA